MRQVWHVVYFWLLAAPTGSTAGCTMASGIKYLITPRVEGNIFCTPRTRRRYAQRPSDIRLQSRVVFRQAGRFVARTSDTTETWPRALRRRSRVGAAPLFFLSVITSRLAFRLSGHEAPDW
ncbi:hypothetical protein BJ166DRAFT_508663 [Pestalotiopsis sp. NC0098]|nr:hypothetical protein BJ166DRAFT_508663 [Pestalotiopsis sp. NC0098]